MKKRFMSILTRNVFILFALVGWMPVQAAAQQVITGTVADGSLYEFDVPVNWNGDLVIYSHGIFDPQAALVLPSQDTQSDFPAVLPGLLSRGYAVASSSWSSNGYAVKDGILRTHQLSGLFVSRVGQPRRTLLYGKSLGALVVTKLVEQFPGEYNGALATCGLLGGGRAELKYMADQRILLDYYFPGALQGDAFHTPTVDFSPGSPAFNNLLASLIGGFGDFRTIEFTFAAHLQVTNPFNPDPTEIITSALTGAGFSARFTNDLLSHTHGHIPFDNVNPETIYTTAPFPLTTPQSDAALNAGVERFTAHPDALNYLAQYYEPTGQLQHPMLTLHTRVDPVNPLFHEDLYATKVNNAGMSDLLVQQTVSRYGHCNFKVDEILNSFDAMAKWAADSSQKPAGGDVTIP
jgi:hypothetical protein